MSDSAELAVARAEAAAEDADNVAQEEELRRALEEAEQQVAERRALRDELVAAIAAHAPRAELEAAVAEATERLRVQEELLRADRATLEALQPAKEEALRVVARLQRLERYCASAEEWVATTLARDVEESVTREQAEAEAHVAALVEELQLRRDDALGKLATLRDRVRERAAELRRGHQREPRTTQAHFATVLSPQARSGERCSSPRMDDSESLDSDTRDMLAFNSSVSGELAVVTDQLRSAHRTRSRYAAESLHLRHDAAKQEAQLTNALRQAELRLARDRRLIGQLHTTNAALVSSLQMLMAQLNVEHYGLQAGPASMIASQRRQEAIEARAASRSVSNGK